MGGAPLQVLHTGCQLCGTTGEGQKQRNHPCPALRDTLEGDLPRAGGRLGLSAWKDRQDQAVSNIPFPLKTLSSSLWRELRHGAMEKGCRGCSVPGHQPGPRAPLTVGLVCFGEAVGGTFEGELAGQAPAGAVSIIHGLVELRQRDGILDDG